MKAGHKKTNANIKLVTGEIRSRDKDQVQHEPQFDTDPIMPDTLKKVPRAVKIWENYMRMGMGTRILTEPDSAAFGTFCIMQAEFDAHVTRYSKGEESCMTPPAAWLAQFRMYAELFGCVPAGRTRIHEKTNPKPKAKTGGGKTNADQAEEENENFFE